MRSSRFRGAVPLAMLVGLLLAASPAASAAAGARSAGPNRRLRHGVSSNWSGYAVSGSGPYLSVSASWTQPAVDCAKTPSGWSAFWVGLDGDTTETVEQTGTEADCWRGKAIYGAWYEMYPKEPVIYREPVSAGGSFTASVTYLGKGKFKLVLSDTTQGWSQTKTKRLKSAQLGSAEAIAEAPSTNSGVLPLADFGSVGFSAMTVNGSLVNGATAGAEPITMASEEGAVEAAPSAISGGGFSDTWFSQ